MLLAKLGKKDWTERYLATLQKYNDAQAKYETYLAQLESEAFLKHDVDIQDTSRRRGEHLNPGATIAWTQLQPFTADANLSACSFHH